MHSRQPASERVVANSLPADALVGTEIDGLPKNGQMHGEPKMRQDIIPASTQVLSVSMSKSGDLVHMI